MSWNEGLSPEQEEAARHIGSHGRLLAGPGTGKTRTLTGRIAFLIEELDVSPSDILAITFTRAATSELRSRVFRLLGGDMVPQIVTLHSFALSTILKRGAGSRLPSPIRIADDYEERWIIQEDLKRYLDVGTIGEVRNLIAQLSADWETLAADIDGWEGRFSSPLFLAAWREHRSIYGYTLRAELVYQLKLALEEGEIQLLECPSYVLIDEYQDLNSCDLAVVKSLSRSGAELYVAGDDDQSIYGFRYANPEGIRRFTNEYNGSADLSLTECRRCAGNILNIGLYVARQDTRRAEKLLAPNREIGDGEVHLIRFRDFAEEASGIASIARWLVDEKGITVDRILILLRSDANHKFSKPIREALENEGLPAAAVENPLDILDSAEARELLSILRLMSNSGDSLAWRTIMMQRRNNLGEQAFYHIYEIARVRGITFIEALRLIQANSDLIERQGELIKNEFEALSQILDRLKETHDEYDEFSSFIDWMFDDIFSGEDWEEINVFIHNLIEINEIDSLESLLKILTTPPQEAGQLKVVGSVNIMTMHQAKGLDADAVFVAAAEDEYIPGRALGEAIDDERRLLYVSLTRARSFLYATHCIQRTGEQRHSGRTSGNTVRHLTQFLSGGPLVSQDSREYLSQINT
ncbi:ATP-dependent helicase [Chloroflexota bacterium]